MSTWLGNVDIGAFLKAKNTFEAFKIDMKTERDKAGAIQAFEFSFELAWKTLKRILAHKGIEVRSPRDCFRQAALAGLIADPKTWFLLLDKRNLTTHTYNEKIIEEIISIFHIHSKALQELEDFIKNEQKQIDLFK